MQGDTAASSQDIGRKRKIYEETGVVSADAKFSSGLACAGHGHPLSDQERSNLEEEVRSAQAKYGSPE